MPRLAKAFQAADFALPHPYSSFGFTAAYFDLTQAMNREGENRATLESFNPVLLEQARSVRLFNVQAPSEGIRSSTRFDGDALFVNVLSRVGSGRADQIWVKWAAANPSPKAGLSLRAILGRARLEGGVALNVVGRESGGRPFAVFGAILNPDLFKLELEDRTKAIGVPRPF